MSRIHELQRIWTLDRAGMEKDCALLAELLPAGQPAAFEALIGIARGGCEMRRLSADPLGVPAEFVCARHSENDAVRSRTLGAVALELAVLHGPSERPRALVVDDICDSGATLDAVTGMLRSRLRPRELQAAVLCRNAASLGTRALDLGTADGTAVARFDK